MSKIKLHKYFRKTDTIHEIQFSARRKQVFTSLLGGAISLLAVMMSPSPTLAGTNINWNELKNGSGPVVFLVNGFGGCAPCITRTLHNKLKANGIAVYDFDWNDIYRRTQRNNFNLADAEFLNQMERVIKAIPQSRPIVLIGHSFGGDSSLKVAQRTSRRIELLGVLDAVELGGIRTGRSVRSNVGYFFNRWTSNPSGLRPLGALPGIPVGAGIPLNPGMSGAVSCSAGTCDQKEQSYGYRADGSAIIDNCKSWEFTCRGYNPIPVALGGSNGTKHRKITHGGDNAIYKDELIQEQLFQKIQQLSLASRSNPSKPVQNRFAAIAKSDKTGRLGWAWGHRSQSEAEKGAIQACKDSDCKTVMWVQNGYAAIAYGDDLSWGASWGKSQEEASQKAIQSCKQFAQNSQSCTIVKVLESTKGTLVNNPIPTKKTATVPTQQPTQTIAALDPQWNYSVFTYEDKRYGGQGRYELKKTNNGVIAIHTNGKGNSHTFSLVEGKPDYVIVSSVISPSDNYYIKLYRNGNAEWTAGKTMHENGWTSWGPGQWLDAGNSENNACVTVDSRQGWQRFNLGNTFTKVASISGGWSVDTRNYSTVGALGHTGRDAERLAPYNQYKHDQNFPFGALLVDIPNYGYINVQQPQQLPQPIGQTSIRINDADNALGDNGGSLQVCFGK